MQCGSKNKYHKIHVFERDWTLCLVWDIYYKVDSQKGGGVLYDHLTRMRIFTLAMNRYSYEAEHYEEIIYNPNLHMLNISC